MNVLRKFAVGALLALPLTAAAPVSAGTTALANPAVRPRVVCKIIEGGKQHVWFGYKHVGTDAVFVPVSPVNVIATNGASAGNKGQIEQFQPGSVTYGFKVTAAADAVVSWTLKVPDLASLPNVVTVSAATNALTPTCSSTLRPNSATPQTINGVTPTVTWSPVTQRRNTAGKLTFASVRFAVNGVVSACSAGGTPMTPTVLWGYAGPTVQIGGAILRSSGDPFVPVAAGSVVRVDSSTYYPSVVRTYVATRVVADPQKWWAFGTNQQQITGTAPAAQGFTTEQLIADVTARCMFGTTVVSSSTKFWIDNFGRPIPFALVTDIPGQFTRNAGWCPINGQPIPAGCDIEMIGVGPGGSRYR